MNKKNEKRKILKKIIILLNIIGIICLVYFLIPYMKHDISIKNPNAMLASYTWDSCGFILTIGFIPLLISNILAYKFFNIKIKQLKLLYFIPSLICLLAVGHYLFFETSWKNEETKSPITTIKCVKNNKVYKYEIYLEDNKEYSVSMDEKDKMPTSIIDYTSIDTITNSIEKYYKDNNGYCS